MSYSREEFRYLSLIGSLLAQKDPYFEQIACCSEEWRETIGDFDVVKVMDRYSLKHDELSPEEKREIQDFDRDIDELYIPICQRKGQASWKRDILTDMAMKLRSVKQVSSAK